MVSLAASSGWMLNLRSLRELPLVLFAAGAGISSGLCWASNRPRLGRNAQPVRRVPFLFGAVVLGVFLVLDLISIRGYMIFADEANILSIAAAWLNGQPMYHAVDASNLCYSLMYGPYTFLIEAPLLRAGGGSYLLLRVAVAAANLATCLVLFSLLRRFVDRTATLCLMALPLSALLANVSNSFGVRSDPWIVLAMTLAARFALIEQPWTAAILTGLTAGAGIGFKATVAPAVLLYLLLLYRRHGLRAAATAGVTAAAVAMAPFLVHGISLQNYAGWLLDTRHHGIARTMLVPAFGYLLFLVTPVLLAVISGLRLRHKSRHASMVAEPFLFSACLVLSCVLAAKPGAGPWHFWPLLPALCVYMAVALARTSDETNRSAGARLRANRFLLMVAAGSLTLVLADLRRDYNALRAPSQLVANELAEGRRELDADLREFTGRALQMGYGSFPSEPSESLRYLLPLAGERYALDGNTVNVEMVAHRPFPAGIADAMTHCVDDFWLIPRGEQPFAGGGDIFFPDSLQAGFTTNFRKQRADAVYDIWSCKLK